MDVFPIELHGGPSSALEGIGQKYVRVLICPSNEEDGSSCLGKESLLNSIEIPFKKSLGLSIALQ